MNERLLVLVERIRGGDTGGFEELYLLTRDRVRFFLLAKGISGDALSELMSDCYAVVLEQCVRFRGEAQVLTWILGIVNLKCKEYFRSRKLQFSPLEELPDQRNYALEAAVSADLKNAIATLTREEYAIFLYRICFRMRYEEMGRLLHVPVGTLKRNVFEIRKKLKNQLRGEGF